MRNPSIFPTKLFLFAFSLLLVFSFQAVAAETYKVDPVHSMTVFRIKHLVSYSYGRFNDLSGTFNIDTETPAKSSVELEVKIESVDTFNEKRDQHLKSPDFFNAKQFPVITFKSKAVKKINEDTYEVTGDLSLHGVTRPLTLKVQQTGAGKDPWGGYRIGFETTFTLKRSEFGITFMPDVVGDEVRMTVSIEGIRQ